MFSAKGLREINFDKITIFYGGNGSGKSTLLNLIACKLDLNRIAPFNSSELFSVYSYECEYEKEYDEEGFRHRIPNGSRIITSDDVFDYMLARSKSVSRRQFIKRTVGQEVKLNSNGETALEYFDSKIQNDTLYCLDEPENSLSPRLQIKLTELLEKMARHCGCQFIIATHSPFLLSMQGARIYDLDETPVDIKQWWELENPRIYFEFFEKHRSLFE